MMLALGLFLGILAFGYLLTAYLAVQRARNDKVPQSPQRLAPVTVLKPLCGAEPGLEQALESLCGQCDSSVQIVFGVQDPADPALPIARALAARYPALDIAIVVDSSRHGHSAKVSNLINMMRVARHDYLVLADSDVHVPAGYLAGVCAPLADPTVGIVTCPYRGRPGRSSGAAGVCSELAALFVNDWFMPSVRVASWLGSRAFAFGATIALRRAVLEDIGGFAAIADQLADDYRLGELTRRRGLRTVLSSVVVETTLDEPGWRALIQHETRWLRTIRAVRPAGYITLWVTFSLPVAALGCAMAGGAPAALAVLIATATARVMLHFAAGAPGPGRIGSWHRLWLLPVSDGLGFALWCWGFATREVQWRQARYRVARDGSARPVT
jgi:ceramide glucosyltransferase